MPDAGVFKRWLQFGMLSSHSRLHASTTYRVPWAFDEESVEVARKFTELKLRLMPYLYGLGDTAARTGAPLLRPMAFEFPEDPATEHLDRQYLLGPDLLVAPVFRGDGTVRFYLPEGQWHHLLTGEAVAGGRWRAETHDFLSLPLYVREGAIIPTGSRVDRPDYDYLDGLELLVTPRSGDGRRTVEVVTPDGRRAEFAVAWSADGIRVTGAQGNWSARLVGGEPVRSESGAASLPS
jgi:alpha-D-xyloside xylohydrolase